MAAASLLWLPVNVRCPCYMSGASPLPGATLRRPALPAAARCCPPGELLQCRPHREAGIGTPVVQEILVDSMKDGRRMDRPWLTAFSGLAGG
ncbi:hypothetical protein [Paenarthrobacter sp. 2TAF44]|uniref:hypothetical protein n=1 Tax=Paenarthrobacter sp. 2TAF44 TaxID=3233018 RepID=UPI003F98FD66